MDDTTGARPKAVRIEIEWDSGRVERSTGADAAAIWGDMQNRYVMGSIRGMPYAGPRMQPVPATDPAAEAARLRAAGDALAEATRDLDAYGLDGAILTQDANDYRDWLEGRDAILETLRSALAAWSAARGTDAGPAAGAGDGTGAAHGGHDPEPPP